MVAITVILAAVIAAFVLDLGDSVGEEAQAGVSIDYNEEEKSVSLEVTSLGNSDYVTFGGVASDFDDTSYNFPDRESNDEDDLSQAELTVGDSVSLDGSVIEAEGTLTAIAVIEDDGTETQVASEDIDIEDTS